MKPGFFRHLVDSLPEGVAVQDDSGRLIYVNDALAEMLGFEREELIGRQSRSLFTTEQRNEYDRQLELRKEGVSLPYETLVEGRHGERLVRITPRALFDKEGSFIGSFATLTGIGDVHRTEGERRVMSEIARAVSVTEDLDELLELIHYSLKRVVYAENLFVALWNPEAGTIYFPYFVDQRDAMPAPLPRGRTCTDYVLRTGEPLLLTDEIFNELVDAGEIELVGSPSPSWMGVPLKTPDKTIGVLAVQHYEDEGAFTSRDLELLASVAGHIALAIEKKRADQALHESRQLLTNVVESMSDGVVVLNRGFEMIYFSRGMEAIAQTPRKEVVGSGKPAWEHFPHLLEVGVAEMMQRAMHGELQRREEIPYRLPNGKVGFTDEIYQPLRTASGETQRVLGVVRDVTDRVQAREELETKEQQLQHAQKMEAVGRLAGGIAHDFNNLLTAINGFAEIVLWDLPPENPHHGLVAEILNAGRRAATLTQKLLALSRKQVVLPRPVELNSMFGRLEDMLKGLAGESVEFVMTPWSEPLRTVLDPGQLEQVVLNLVVNAVDAMPSGGRLEIRTLRRDLNQAAAEHEVVPGSYVGFEIADTGSGINEEIRTRIFEPFFTTKEAGKGTGLGLAIAYGIVKQNDGYIWVESEPGSGTRFRVYFPQSFAGTTPVTKRAKQRPPPRGSETLLLVEDERGVRSLMSRILERQGYRVLEASSAAQALKLFDDPERSVDMVITDVVMPHMSGPELASRLTEASPGLKMLFISGHLGETIDNQGLLENAELLAKPFSADGLIRKVRAMLDRSSQSTSGARR